MSKLSPSLKALINAPFARPGPCPSSARIAEVFESVAKEASAHKVGIRPWLTLSAAASFTLNSPDSLSALYQVASRDDSQSAVQTAELIREVGLKCISFNGIPRSINCLNAFHASLPAEVSALLATKATRTPTSENLPGITERGQKLWNSVYAGYEVKLFRKLGVAHPDLPVHILNSHYGPLLSDPATISEDSDGLSSPARLGRILTSITAISCLRAQTGVGPQLLSHVFGLRKALADETWRNDEPVWSKETVEWLASDEGSEWLLRSVDRIVEELGGSTFAPSRRSKL